MKLVKTIVATAVVVFALTTVAMAGVQRLGHGTEAAAGAAQPQPAASSTAGQPATQPNGAVILSAQQFAVLLRAARDGDGDQLHPAAHDGSAARTRTKDQTRQHTATHTAQMAQTSAGSGGGAAHRTTTQTRTHTDTHDGGTHSARTHDGGTHGGGGGCD